MQSIDTVFGRRPVERDPLEHWLGAGHLGGVHPQIERKCFARRSMRRRWRQAIGRGGIQIQVEFQVRGAGQLGHTFEQGDAGTRRRGRRGRNWRMDAQAQRVGTRRQRTRRMRIQAAGGDGFDPLTQVAHRLGGEVAEVPLQARAFRQARVVQLLAGPCGLAEVLQADHARTALERVKRTPDQRQVTQIVRPIAQARQRLARALKYLARLVDEDLAHLHVVFQAGAAMHFGLGLGRGTHRLLHGYFAMRGFGQSGHRLRQLGACRLALRVVGGTLQRRARRHHGLGQRTLVSQQRLL